MSRNSSTARTMLSAAVTIGLGIGSLAFAQDSPKLQEEVTVEAMRSVTVGRATSGAPIKEVTTQRRVSLSGISLTTSSGMKVAETRIRDAAVAACNELEQE